MSIRPGPFFAALATVILAALALEMRARDVLDPEASREPLALLAHERDDHGRLMETVLDAPDASAANLFVVGGSTVREGFLPDAIVQQQLDEVLGSDAPRITTLYSFDQSMAETVRIVGNLELAAGDTVVIEVNPRRLGFGPDSWSTEYGSSRLSLLDVEALDRVGGELPEVSNDLFDESISPPSTAAAWFTPWSQLTVFDKRLFARNWIEGRLPSTTSSSWGALTSGELGDVEWGALGDLEARELRRPLRYGFGAVPLEPAEKAEIALAVADERVPAFDEFHRFDASVLAALGRQVEAAGAELVLLQLPRSPQSKEAYGPVWETHDAVVDEVASYVGADPVDLRELPFQNDDFFDLEHLLPEGRPSVTEAFLAELFGTEFTFS